VRRKARPASSRRKCGGLFLTIGEFGRRALGAIALRARGDRQLLNIAVKK
jgi:hypothetical protein